MVVGAKVCELRDGFLWFVCGNFDIFPKFIIKSSLARKQLYLTVQGKIQD